MQHQFEIEKMFELHGLKYLSSPRKREKGGVSSRSTQVGGEVLLL